VGGSSSNPRQQPRPRGRSGEPETGSNDSYKRRREERAKGKESMGHEEKRGVENSEGSMNGAKSNSLENSSKGTQSQINRFKKKSDAPPSPNTPSRMMRILTINIDGHSKAKWTYPCNLSCFNHLYIIIMTKHHLSSTFRPVHIVESGWSIQQVAGVQKRRSWQHEYRGVVAIITHDAAGIHLIKPTVIDACSAFPHQAVSWKISSHNLAHPFHITGMYMSPSEGMVEEFFHTLAKKKTSPPTNLTYTQETITHM